MHKSNPVKNTPVTSTIIKDQVDPELREKITKQVTEWLKRPAKRQADPNAGEETQKVFEGAYNIWYNKWTGQKHQGRFEFGERAPSRVNIARETGFTLADKRRAKNPTHRATFCLYFARGNCPRGHKCEHLHRIPLPDDVEDTMKDCFGRERTRDEREDNNGVGSFNRTCQTIYIGGMHPYEKGDAEKVIQKHFVAFGPIERLNVIYDKIIAFVRYEKRANAEFAKEAMDHQALDAGEVIRIRWANDDPNPKEIAAVKKRTQQEFIESYVSKKVKTGEVEYMDQEMRTLIESNPLYKQYYSSYKEESDGPAESNPVDTTDDPGPSPTDEIAAEAYRIYLAQMMDQYHSTNASQTSPSGGVDHLPTESSIPTYPNPSDSETMTASDSRPGALVAYDSEDEDD